MLLRRTYVRIFGAQVCRNIVEEVKRFTDGEGVDVVLDMVSGDYVARNMECLAEDGRHVTIAVLGGLKAEINMATVMRKRLSLTGSTLRPRSDEFKALIADEIYHHAWPLFEERAVAPVMDQTFPLAEGIRGSEVSRHDSVSVAGPASIFSVRFP